MNTEFFAIILTVVGGCCLCAFALVLHKFLQIAEIIILEHFKHGSEKANNQKRVEDVEDDGQSTPNYAPSYHNQAW